MLRGLVASVFVLMAGMALAEIRVALVIGNSAYEHASPLTNPANDSQAMAGKLGALGFEVFLHRDLGGQDMRVALGEFAEAALGADVALMFYAGHGIEMEGRNFLVPVDAKMRSEATAQFEALPLDFVIETVGLADKLGVVLLDACRDNPFASAMTRKSGTRSMSRGLAPISLDGQQGLVVSFAAEAGTTADDGAGMHSPYTKALLDVIDEPGLEVGRMFRKIRAQVRASTNGRQVPIERMQLPDEAVFFRPHQAGPVTQPETPVVVPAPPKTREPVEMDPMVVYLEALQSGEVGPLSDFLSRYPDHPRAADARKLVLSMQEDAFWKQIVAEDSVQGYRRYLLAFSSGQYADQAAEKIAMLTQPETPVVAPPAITPKPDPTPINRGRVAPSFDCNRASTAVEHGICNSNDLSRQDHELAVAYRTARDRGRVSSSRQRQWIKERNAACGPLGNQLELCISRMSGDRIAALQSGRLSGNVAPGFNCAKAVTAVERTICGSDVLARQDQHLLKVYKSARANGWQEARAQRGWIADREARCGGRGSGVAVCVAGMTASRIRQLGRR